MSKVKLTNENGLSMITLNRPDSYNALDIESLEQLLKHIRTVKQNDNKVIVLAGEGRAFCAGGDIAMMQKMYEPSDFRNLMDIISDIAIELFLMPKIVISAVNGSAAGLGFSIALHADYIVANEQAKFGMLFAGIGLIPDGGGHYLLEQRLGTHKAKQFIWGLEQVSGEDAKQYGFVDVVTDGDALDAAKELAIKLLSSPILALIESKLIYHEKNANELREVLKRETESQIKMRATKDHVEGVTAFLEKRKPNFKGE